MILPNAPGQRSVVCPRRSHAAFTLVELLAVMVIILVLAGLILNVAGSTQYKAALARATTEIKQMEVALENYKSDNGAYPQGNAYGTNTTPPAMTSTDALNAQSNTDPTAAVYSNACEYLYQQLSGNTQPGVAGTAFTKAYIAFLPGQLSTGTAAATTSTYVIDPFGFCYGYSTANAYAVANNPTTATQYGYNPTFDLWSTAGYAAGGKTPPSPPTGSTQQAYDATLWVKNW